MSRVISIPETSTNVAFGGKDWKTLFITAGTSLYSIQVDVAGIPFYTAISQFQTGNLNAYPNPTNGILHVDLEKSNFVQVFNLSGLEVLSFVFSGGSEMIDMSILQNGYYIVKIEDGKGTRSYKVLIQK